MSKPRYGWWPYAKWMIRSYKGGSLMTKDERAAVEAAIKETEQLADGGERLLNGGPIAGWFPEDVPDCYTVLLKNAEKQLRRTGNWWRWDDIFRVYRCPACGRPEKPHVEVWKNGGVKRVLPRQCQYCQATLEGIEGEENDH